MEDENGNRFSAWGMKELDVTLVNQNNEIKKLKLAYNRDFGGYYLNTTSLDYGTYTIFGELYENTIIGAYDVKPGKLTIVDESGRIAQVLSSNGLTKVYGTNNNLMVTLKDGFGNPIDYTLITVSLNGKITTIITDGNGKASLAVNLVPKTYTAYIRVGQNSHYFAASITAKIVIKKLTPKIISSKKTFKLKTKMKLYSIVLKDNFGKPIKKVKVTIKIKKKTYKVKTNAKGKATFKLKLNKKGKYSATVKFAGNVYYTKITKKIKITVKK